MVQPIIEQFETAFNVHRQLIAMTEQKFHAMKTKNNEALRQLDKEEMACFFAFETETKKLQNVIQTICREKNTEQPVLSSLLPLVSVEEKEQLMACQKTAISLDRQLKNNLKMNECLALALMEASRAIVETAVHIANQEKTGDNLFINEEL